MGNACEVIVELFSNHITINDIIDLPFMPIEFSGYLDLIMHFVTVQGCLISLLYFVNSDVQYNLSDLSLIDLNLFPQEINLPLFIGSGCVKYLK